MASPGYSDSKDQLLSRLARVEGQIGGITRMVEDDRYCIDVLTQINAARAALDRIALGLVDGHARHCMAEGTKGSPDEMVDELMGSLARMVR
jgi:CsoR family transcriptional regulator, copper-sensing transcriptional repressor